MLWFLKLLANGQQCSISSAKNSLRDTREIDIQENEKYALSQRTFFDVKFGWARYYLKQCDLIQSHSSGFFSITPAGQKLLAEEPTEIFLQVEKLNNGPFRYQVFPIKAGTEALVKRAQAGTYESGDDVLNVLAYLEKIQPVSLLVNTAESPYVKDGLIELLFGTCRKIGNTKKVNKFFTNERECDTDVLKTGVVVVSVPSKHLIGLLERPPWYYLWKARKGRDFILESIQTLDSTAFSLHINKKYADKLPRIFVFVHGFNVSFENAALRTAQMAIDLGLEACPAFFSWPSDVDNYFHGTGNARLASSYLATFLMKFASKTLAAEIVVIAHSMGSEVASEAITIVRSTSTSEIADKFQELVLAAPDLDADHFRTRTMPRLAQLKQAVTIYGCKADLALAVSRKINGAPRAGDIPYGLFTNPFLDTVDATNVATDFFGHSYFSSGESLISDMKALVVGKKRAASRIDTLNRTAFKTIPFWLLRESKTK